MKSELLNMTRALNNEEKSEFPTGIEPWPPEHRAGALSTEPLFNCIVNYNSAMIFDNRKYVCVNSQASFITVMIWTENSNL